MCRRPKKANFFLGLGRFWTFCPLRDLSPFPPYRSPYGQTALREGPLRGGFLREGPFLRETLLITGKLTGRLGPYGKPLTRRDGPYGKGRFLTGRAGPLRVLHTEERRRRGLREGRALMGSPLRGGTVLTRRAGPLREGPGSLTGSSQRRTTKRLTGRQAYGKPLTGRNGPYGKGRGPLRGWVPSQRRTTFNYRKAYGKLRGGTLPELGGNFRLCAIDQKRSFFPRVGPFLHLLPFKGFPLTGALTGRPTYGKAPDGEASYGKAPYCVFVRMLPYPLLFRLQVFALMRNVLTLWLKVPLRG